MHDALAVGLGQAAAHLRQQLERLADGQGTLLLDDRGEGDAGHVLHDDEGRAGALVEARVVHGHHARMGQPGRGAGLAPEALEELGLQLGRGQQRPGDGLHGHQPVQLRVVGLVDRAHGALAEQLQDAVAAELGRWRQAGSR